MYILLMCLSYPICSLYSIIGEENKKAFSSFLVLGYEVIIKESIKNASGVLLDQRKLLFLRLG
jgi:hypothetical protein